MKKSFVYTLFLMIVLASCTQKEVEDHSYTIRKYEKMGMPDCDRIWNNNDFFNAVETLDEVKATDFMALPRYDSRKSGKLFRHLISMENLSFLESDTISLRDKAYKVQAFLGIQSDLVRIYTNLYGKEQYYEKELAQLYMFGLTVTQKMLDLAYKINASSRREDQIMKGSFPTIRTAYVTMLTFVLEQQKHTSLYKEEDMEVLTDSVTASMKKNMYWFDRYAIEILKKKLQTVIDSTSSGNIRQTYQKLFNDLDAI